MAAAARVRDRAAPSPASDVYVGLLGVSLVALILGCVLLTLDWREYPQTKAPAAPAYTGLPKAMPEGGGGSGGGVGGGGVGAGGGGGGVPQKGPGGNP